ncbi:MAG: FadR family transcriptional regulator [Synergistaceae bacterium]|jgi:GntR family transcriptional repressor for pyruvate dehydrogenase complex|nr:FadR family transcriptional regulator [Synergistaceae bacterium]MDD2350883.1 FadR/GntR family transcriptional regulator [Synergistaceae bacterium]MDD3319287.1 FadR/GntR family transcriptional regulator [Synergistaceae bacterium]MDD3672441.1 FadR/GntR family transcriptional regulator [Synergistaceae bacterium]MDD3964122.1 FadR/GntR family transcriptional regulator [Synergistaceae bacterium]
MEKKIDIMRGSGTKPSELKTERLSSRISKLILSEIQSGMLLPGDRLPAETVLAEKYGVSRTILREAIASLKNDDILESKQGRGIIVKNPNQRQAFRFSDVFETISVDEINYFYEMRALLESEAAGLAAVRHTKEDMVLIKKAFKEMEEAVRSSSPGDEAHFKYNEAIAKASHNPVLIEFLSFLQNKLHSLATELRIKTMMSPERAETVLSEHRHVVESIFTGDPQKAKQAVMTHLKNAAERAGMNIYMP